MSPKKKIPYDQPQPDDFGLASRGEGKAPQIRHQRPEVARHVARMILAHNGDTQAAVVKMLAKTYPAATEAQIESIAATIRKSPYVQREMTQMLEQIGIGDDALKKLIGILWQEALGSNDKRWPSAMRLLAEITGAAKAGEKDKTLPKLRLAGMEEGLSVMLGDAAPTNEDIEVTPEDDAGILDIDGDATDNA